MRRVQSTYGFGLGEVESRRGHDDAALLVTSDVFYEITARSRLVSALIGYYFTPIAGIMEPDERFEPSRLSIIDRFGAITRIALDHGTWPAKFTQKCPHCEEINLLTIEPADFVYEPVNCYFVEFDGARFMQPNGNHEGATNPNELITLCQCADGTPAIDANKEADVIAALEQVAPKFAPDVPYA